jgi:hypothetical protein
MQTDRQDIGFIADTWDQVDWQEREFLQSRGGHFMRIITWGYQPDTDMPYRVRTWTVD